MKARRWLLRALVVVILLFFIAVWIVGGLLVSPANRPVGPPPNPAVIATTLQSKSGSAIATWYIPAVIANDAKATVVLAHPIRGDRRSMLSRAQLFRDNGFSIVMIDLQAHGESPGTHITIGHLERHDVVAAVEFARTQNPDHRIGVLGRSLGGAAALLGSPLSIDALVLESVYPTIDRAVENRIAMRLGPLSHVLSPLLLAQMPFRLGFSTKDLRPVDHIAAVGCPVLVAAGDLDQHTTIEETNQLIANAAEPKRLVVFKGAAHEDLLKFDSERYEAKVLSFLLETLVPSESPIPTLESQ